MRLLLDECLPRKLKRELAGHDVKTVSEMGWKGKKNGELLLLMDGAIDVFITIDQSLPAQQRLTGRSFAVIVLVALSNRFENLAPLIPDVLSAIPSVPPGQITRISGS